MISLLKPPFPCKYALNLVKKNLISIVGTDTRKKGEREGREQRMHLKNYESFHAAAQFFPAGPLISASGSGEAVQSQLDTCCLCVGIV